MPIELPRIKISVLKRMVNEDLIREYIDEENQNIEPCNCFEDGQEIIIDPLKMPDNFCVWAWADIRKDILTLAYGGDMPGMKQPGIAITGCSDWFRPVIFKLERI